MIFKRLFGPPSALEIAQKELEDTKRLLLAQRAVAEHSAKMVEYYDGMVRRLAAYITIENTIQAKEASMKE